MAIQNFDLHAEQGCVLVPLSEAKTLPRDDNRITVTLNQALKYLENAFEITEIANKYKKFFASIIYEAKAIENPNINKNFLINEVCEQISNIDPSGFKLDTLDKINKISLPFLAIDKKRGELFLIANMPVQKENSFDLQLTLVKVSISETPSIADWTILESNLGEKSCSGDYLYSWHEEKKYTTITPMLLNFNEKVFKNVTFTYENNVTNMYKYAGVNKDYPTKDEDPDYIFLERKYLVLTNYDESKRYFKFPVGDTHTLIPDERNQFSDFLPLSSEAPTSGCYFIEKRDLVKIFFNTVPATKSAKSHIRA